MRLIANYHTHTKLCGHADGMSEDYIIEALKAGLQELGFSDHGPIPRNFMSEEDYLNNYLERQMNEKSFEDIYLKDLDSSIKKYRHQIKLWKGLEIEYLSGHDDYYRSLLTKLDYLTLGIHYFELDGTIHNTYDFMGEKEIEAYAINAEKAMDSGFFKILNHPDLFLMNYTSKTGSNDFDHYCLEASKRIIEAAIRNHVYLEINGGGTRRPHIFVDNQWQYQYPREAFWRVVETYPDALVIIGCDTHNPVEIYDQNIKDLCDYADKFTFKVSDRIKLDE